MPTARPPSAGTTSCVPGSACAVRTMANATLAAPSIGASVLLVTVPTGFPGSPSAARSKTGESAVGSASSDILSATSRCFGLPRLSMRATTSWPR